MFRKMMMSAAAAVAMSSFCAAAHAQVLVEIEGPLSAAIVNATGGTLTVMNNKVVVNAETELVSPTGSRSTILNVDGTPRFNARQWILGGTYNGRVLPGLLGGTVIVTGELDPVTGLITASEVFSDVAENVVLGAISEANCTTLTCQGPTDFIRGNGGSESEGVVFVPNLNPRLRAGRIADAGLFEIDGRRSSNGAALVGATFGGEGYFSDNKIFPLNVVDNPETPDVIEGPDEQALVYWAFELGENRPDLIRNHTIAEISSLRIRCTEGDRIEVRGFVHTPVFADGSVRPLPNRPTASSQGFIRVEMDVNGDDIIENTAQITEQFDGDAATPDVPASYGVYRLREDIDQCGASANVYWMNADGSAPWASLMDVPVDRLREE